MLILDKSSPLRVEKLLILLHVERRGWGRGGEEGEGEGGKSMPLLNWLITSFPLKESFVEVIAPDSKGRTFFRCAGKIAGSLHFLFWIFTSPNSFCLASSCAFVGSATASSPTPSPCDRAASHVSFPSFGLIWLRHKSDFIGLVPLYKPGSEFCTSAIKSYEL